jgi:hypothetical protein
MPIIFIKKEKSEFLMHNIKWCHYRGEKRGRERGRGKTEDESAIKRP